MGGKFAERKKNGEFFRRENSSPKKMGLGMTFWVEIPVVPPLRRCFFCVCFGGPKYLLRTDITSFRPGVFFSVFIYLHIYIYMSSLKLT